MAGAAVNHRVRRSVLGLALTALLLASVAALSGCDGTISHPPLVPKVAPPVIGKAGELRAAIDLDYPPYGAQEGNRTVGLDLDVAAALADRLGLRLTVANANPSEGALALSKGQVDVVFGGLTIDDALAGGIAFAGAYTGSAPALFTSEPGSFTIDSVGGRTVAAQRGSLAYWALGEQYGVEQLQTTPTLREAMQQAAGGKVQFAAGDAVVGSYMLRDFGTLRLAGQLGPASPVGVGVSRDNPKLEAVVRDTLDSLATDGVLDTLVRKWAGDLSMLQSGTATPVVR